ncbi:MAG: FHA domain-containing protein [Myxococcaceae bacterium]|nr:FHA domain-containing protein [Myxococcaceae bacterium]MCI0673676.1 FHA domain-containing protein [Myxococcaceae bacterium]
MSDPSSSRTEVPFPRSEDRERKTWLVQIRGPRMGSHLSLEEGQVLTFGRAPDCNVVLPSQDVSRYHTRLVTHEGRTVAEDLGSTNGTRVNDELLAEPRELRDGDMLEVVGFVFRFLHDTTLWQAMRETQ